MNTLSYILVFQQNLPPDFPPQEHGLPISFTLSFIFIIFCYVAVIVMGIYLYVKLFKFLNLKIKLMRHEVNKL